MSSKRRRRRKECLGKVRYETTAEAAEAARGASRKSGDDIHPYRCRHCYGHHIGHRPYRVRQAEMARKKLLGGAQ